MTNQDSAGIEIGQLCSLEMALNIHERGFSIAKLYQIAKKIKNMKHFVTAPAKVLNWRQKWFADVQHGNSLVVSLMSPGRIIVVLL